MIDFQRFQLSQKEAYEALLWSDPAEQGCEYAFANMVLWGRQECAFLEGCVVFFSHWDGHSVYPYPIGSGDRRAALERILADSRERGIPCRITNMRRQDLEELERWFPDRFITRSDREGWDYVYDIRELAELKGRKFQKKRNHLNRFQSEHPEAAAVPITAENREQAREMVNAWFERRIREDPAGDYVLEQVAMERAFRYQEALNMEALMLVEGERVLAVTMGSRLSADTMDIHFEKALEDADGAYAAINWHFARYLREKYPELRYLNREDDVGEEGLRKAKLSYHPHHLLEQFWACRGEDIHGDFGPEDFMADEF